MFYQNLQGLIFLPKFTLKRPIGQARPGDLMYRRAGLPGARLQPVIQLVVPARMSLALLYKLPLAGALGLVQRLPFPVQIA